MLQTNEEECGRPLKKEVGAASLLLKETFNPSVDWILFVLYKKNRDEEKTKKRERWYFPFMFSRSPCFPLNAHSLFCCQERCLMLA